LQAGFEFYRFLSFSLFFVPAASPTSQGFLSLSPPIFDWSLMIRLRIGTIPRDVQRARSTLMSSSVLCPPLSPGRNGLLLSSLPRSHTSIICFLPVFFLACPSPGGLYEGRTFCLGLLNLFCSNLFVCAPALQSIDILFPCSVSNRTPTAPSSLLFILHFSTPCLLQKSRFSCLVFFLTAGVLLFSDHLACTPGCGRYLFSFPGFSFLGCLADAVWTAASLAVHLYLLSPSFLFSYFTPSLCAFKLV